MNRFTLLKAKHIRLGKRGEAIARNFLKNKSYDILMKNYKVKKGEIDIIARDGSTICFIEVKTRKYTKSKINNPKILLSHRQSKRIQKASQDYLYELGNSKLTYRYELIEIFLSNYITKTIYHWTNDFGK
jgi:putative endonuclease